MGKKKIIKKFEQLSPELLKLLKNEYPEGFEENLITIPLPTGELALALPFETEDTSYLIKMPKKAVSDNDDDDDSSGGGDDFDPNFDGLEAAEDVADDD
ncbi:MAG: hypothetical protein JXA77_05965 [Bacteroidales bacterium]|nr:hypothetical protein [Bacteroidales bacterium]MBN2820584.1 hypothetical protein [Bacteroidales bacterium]